MELQEVLLKVELLKDEEQRQIANLLKQAVLWETAFQTSPEALGHLAKEALQEHKAGKTTETDW